MLRSKQFKTTIRFSEGWWGSKKIGHNRMSQERKESHRVEVPMLLKESYWLSYCASCLLHRVSYYKGLRRMRPATKRSKSQVEGHLLLQFHETAVGGEDGEQVPHVAAGLVPAAFAVIPSLIEGVFLPDF